MEKAGLGPRRRTHETRNDLKTALMVESSLNTPKKPKPLNRSQEYKSRTIRKHTHTKKKKRAHSIGDDNKYTHGNERKGNRWEIQQQQIKNNETGEVKLETRDKRLPK